MLLPMVTRYAVLVAALLCACKAKETSPATATQPPNAEPQHVKASPADPAPVKPPPPAGVVLPRSAKLRVVHPGDAKTAYVWQAIYDADAQHPAVKQALEAATKDGLTLDAGDAAVSVYADELRAAGVEVSDLMGGFMYRVEPGTLDVIVRSDDDFHRGDPTGFTISVGPAGG